MNHDFLKVIVACGCLGELEVPAASAKVACQQNDGLCSQVTKYAIVTCRTEQGNVQQVKLMRGRKQRYYTVVIYGNRNTKRTVVLTQRVAEAKGEKLSMASLV